MSGVFPLGVFMLLELWLHAKALDGPDAYRGALAMTTSSAAAVVKVLIIVPLLFHAGYGLTLAARSRYTVGRYPSSRNWMYTLQRLSGVVVLLFLGYHAATFWLPMQLGHATPADAYGLRVAQLSTTAFGVPWIAFGYLMGLAACCFHLANGLWRFGSRWGLWIGTSAKSWAGVVMGVLGTFAFVAAANTVVFLATGWRAVGKPIDPSDQAVECPAESSAAPSTARSAAAAAPSGTTSGAGR